VLDDCNGHGTPGPQPHILPEKLNEIITFVRHNIIEAQQRNKAYYDLSHIKHLFKEGVYVLLTNHQLSNKEEGIMQKLTPRFVGPYQLGRQLTPVTFEVHSLPDFNKIGKRHVNDLRMFYVRPDFDTNTLKKPNYNQMDRLYLNRVSCDNGKDSIIEPLLGTTRVNKYS
jgi:hypothetical protein